MKLLKFSIGGLLLVCAVSYGYLWYATTKNAGQMIDALAPFAEAEYGGVSVSPFGRASINAVEITPHGAQSRITIAALSVEADSLFELIELGTSLRRNDPPRRLVLTASGVKVPLYGGVIPSAGADDGAGQQLEALACGDIDAFRSKHWRAMGYDELVFDARFGYDYDRRAERVAFDAAVDVADGGALTFATELPIGELIQAALTRRPAGLERIDIAWTDRGMYARVAAFCAEQNGADADAYRRAHVQRLEQSLRGQGLALAEPTLAAYRRWIDGGRRLEVVLRPDSAVSALDDDAGFQDFFALLRPQLWLDGEFIDVAWTRVAAAADAPADGADAGADDAQDDRPDPRLRQRRERARLTFDAASPADAGSHIGRLSIITMLDGRRYRGQIEQVKDDVIAVRVSMGGGSVTYHLRTAEVADYQIGAYRPDTG